jgi:hypothetical protein
MLAPWLAYSYGVSGTLMPTSGLAQQAWEFSLWRASAGLSALGQVGLPVYLGALEGRASAVGRVVLLPVLGAAAIHWASARWHAGGAEVRRSLAFAAMIATATTLLALWYSASSWASHFYVRYFAVLLLASSLALGLAIAALSETRPRMAAALGVLLAVHSLGYVAALHGGVYLGSRMASRVTWSRPVFADQLRLVRENVPAADTVAAGQSGTLGYFRDRVMNVDGKVNGEALRHQREMSKYLASRDARWFCDMPSYVDRYLGINPAADGWRLVATSGLFHLYRREWVQ